MIIRGIKLIVIMLVKILVLAVRLKNAGWVFLKIKGVERMSRPEAVKKLILLFKSKARASFLARLVM